MHIQNPAIFRILARYIHSSVKAYAGIFRTLYNARIWEPCHVKDFATFRISVYLRQEVYSGSCLFTHIQAYSGILNSDSYNNVLFFFTFFFSLFFQRNLKRHVFDNNASISMLVFNHVFLGNQVLWYKTNFSDQILSHKKFIRSQKFLKNLLRSPLIKYLVLLIPQDLEVFCKSRVWKFQKITKY